MHTLTPLEQLTSLKGLFKGKGDLRALVEACLTARDDLIQQALPALLSRARVSPLHLLPVHLTRQATAAGTTFLRWRRVDRAAMGVAQWQALLVALSTRDVMVPTLYRLERQRILLNAQISLTHSLTHSLAQLAHRTLDQLTHAERIHQQRLDYSATEAS
ncbi:Integrase regulator R [Pseudomonas sp. R4-34-07]|uniref:DUF3158 family protein n=1 Tax=Pseudomonas sp. R4-34-07 TaxID=658642 RepID=UPI000F574477|nr:DUF3158 family protein [Pseudomonas sp. R4-34-07]AZF53215.1 Integrase regulator R [Pseudomonas sp. R4-34-07]